MPTTRQPTSLPICPTVAPTGPVAAATAIVSPDLGAPICFNPAQAVKPGMPRMPSAKDGCAGDWPRLVTPLPSETA